MNHSRHCYYSPPPIRERSIVITVRVCVRACMCECVFVCLSAIISITRPIFTKFIVHITCGCGSIFLWWRRNMLCTSGLWMTYTRALFVNMAR